MDWATMLFPGEFCKTTGIYKVVHYQHRVPHHVAVSEAEPFPVCKKCLSKVRYFRTTPEDHIHLTMALVDDPDLNGMQLAQ